MPQWDVELIMNRWRDTVSALEENTLPLSRKEMEQLRADFRQARGLVTMQTNVGDQENNLGISAEIETLEERLEGVIGATISMYGRPKGGTGGRLKGFVRGLLHPILRLIRLIK